MVKRGQVTIFIILGLVILIAFALVIYLSYSGKTASFKDLILLKTNVPEQVKPINEFILECVKGTLNDGIWFNSQRSGYYNIQQLSTNDNIAYYFYDSRIIMPSQTVIEKELSSYVNENLAYCTNNFNEFPSFIVNQSKITSLVKFDRDKINIKVNYPVEIKKGTQTFKLNNFEYEQDSRLFSIYDIANKIVNLQFNDKENICLSCLSDLSSQNNVTIDLNEYDNDTIIFTINDKNLLINKVPLELKFAVKYE